MIREPEIVDWARSQQVLAMVELAVGSRNLLVLVLFDLTLLGRRFSVSFNLFSSFIFSKLLTAAEFWGPGVNSAG